MKKITTSRSAYFYVRTMLGVMLCFAGVALAFFGFSRATAQGPRANRLQQAPSVFRGVSTALKFDVSPPLRDMVPVLGPGALRENEDQDIVPRQTRFFTEPDTAVQSVAGTIRVDAPLISFDGQNNVSSVSPPDPNGAVGLNHIVTMANLQYQIFNKTGTSLLGPTNTNTIWAGFGGNCQTTNSGDPVVLYDRRADRWILTQFTATSAPFFNCVAVSTSPDPTGTYFRYAFGTGPSPAFNNFPDYPKFGIGRDAYFISTREFSGSTSGPFAGVGVYALNRAQMLAGNPAAQVISFLAPPTPAFNVGDGLLPMDMEGPNPPPAGAPHYYLGSMDNNGPNGAPQDALTLWKFVVDFATPANSSFTLTNTIPTQPFNSILGLCGGGRACIPQLGSTNRLDHLGYRQRPLFRLVYRNFGDHESLVTNQSVSAGTGPGGEVSGIRWWEVRSPNVNPVIFQEGTYAPGLTDSIHRWMGSMAIDGEGNIGLAYSASSATINPGMRYTGRFPNSPLGTMPVAEMSIVDGTGAQTGSNRWGDYTSLTLDPVDDTTMWYVNEYVPTTSSVGWRLRIGAFKISSVPTNILSSGGSAIASAGANGVLDPGETVNVSLGALNSGGPGTICTSNLVGTLQPGGGVTAPGPAQNFGAVCSGGPAVLRNFTFTVDPALPCGSTVTASVALTDGATSFGTLTYTFTTGSNVVSTVENFDSVVAPALPSGWVATQSGSGVLPTTSTTSPDTAPNDVFLSEQASVGLSEITSAPVLIPSAGVQLSFRNLFNTEPNFDGLVLEISIPSVSGGAFQDIVTAGGTFASGGYNSALPTTFMNPLPSRAAWTGLSGGTAAAPTYISTVVNLPAAAVGQSVMFKWRQGSDSSVAPTNPGSRIDTIRLTSTVCNTTTPTVSSAVSRKVHGAAGTFDIPLPLGPLTGAIGIEPRTDVAGQHQIVVTFANPVTVGNAAVTTGAGAAAVSVSGGTVTINLTGVTDVQRLGLTLSNVSDGTNIGSVMVPIGILSGDTSGNASVSAGDVSQTKAAAAAGTVNASTFRTDVIVNGTINASDIGSVKAKSGNNLP